MLARILGGADVQNPAILVRTPNLEASNVRSGNSNTDTADIPSSLSDMRCSVPIHANETVVARNALIVVDYSLGGAAFPEHEHIWMGMAHALTQHNTRQVSVLFAAGADVDWAKPSMRASQLHYKGNPIVFEYLRPPTVPRDAPPHVALAYDVYEWILDEKQVDIIYFLDWGGLGYYVMNAKQQGEQFRDVELNVLLHGPHIWQAVHSSAQDVMASARALQASFMERRTVEMADAVIARSGAMVQWLKQTGWTMPTHAYVASWPLPPSKAPTTVTQQVGELVCPVGELTRLVGELTCHVGELTCHLSELTCPVGEFEGGGHHGGGGACLCPVCEPTFDVRELTCPIGEFRV
jgi:hypothetical protein